MQLVWSRDDYQVDLVTHVHKMVCLSSRHDGRSNRECVLARVNKPQAAELGPMLRQSRQVKGSRDRAATD
jgi:hypothetical protein